MVCFPRLWALKSPLSLKHLPSEGPGQSNSSLTWPLPPSTELVWLRPAQGCEPEKPGAPSEFSLAQGCRQLYHFSNPEPWGLEALEQTRLTGTRTLGLSTNFPSASLRWESGQSGRDKGVIHQCWQEIHFLDLEEMFRGHVSCRQGNGRWFCFLLM